MFFWLLNLVYLASLAVYVPIRLVIRRKSIAGWRQKFLGRVPLRPGKRNCLWIHAVSVGEVMQLQPILAALAAQRPDLELVISTTTSTGYDVACQRYPERMVFYFPFDFSWAVAEALDRIRPTAIALVELELWPNFVLAASKRRIPLALINGRIGEKSYRGYRRIKPVMRSVLSRFDLLAVQSKAYAERLIDLGAIADRVSVTGSIKFDGVEFDRSNSKTAMLKQFFGIDDEEIVFLAGSTQDPEERLAIETYLKLRARHPRLRLILVPRHQERFEQVARLVAEEFRLPLFRRSQGLAAAAALGEQIAPPICLLDTLGELSACWGLASIAFVGGSLTQRGGQNMIEPSGYGAAVLFGPNTWNFKDVVELLLGNDAARVIRSGAELTECVGKLLDNPLERSSLGSRARQLVAAQRGATARTLERLLVLLPQELPAPIQRVA